MDIQKLIVVAAYLDGWRLDHRNPSQIKLINGCYSLFIREGFGSDRGKWFISGCAPLWTDKRPVGFGYMLGRDIDLPRIGVSFKRDAKSIANDIERRLIPNYIKLYNEALRAIEKKEKQITWCNNITHLVKRLLGAEYNYNGRSQMKYETERRLSWGSYNDPNGSGEVRISAYNGGYMDIKICNLHPDKAIKLIALYKAEIVNNEQTT